MTLYDSKFRTCRLEQASIVLKELQQSGFVQEYDPCGGELIYSRSVGGVQGLRIRVLTNIDAHTRCMWGNSNCTGSCIVNLIYREMKKDRVLYKQNVHMSFRSMSENCEDVFRVIVECYNKATQLKPCPLCHNAPIVPDTGICSSELCGMTSTTCTTQMPNPNLTVQGLLDTMQALALSTSNMGLTFGGLDNAMRQFSPKKHK